MMGVAPRHPCSRMQRKMLTPARTGQAAADSDRKWETDSSSGCILLVVQGEDNLSSVLKLLDGGVSWEESVSREEDEVHEGP